jgi:hypothetical protein
MDVDRRSPIARDKRREPFELKEMSSSPCIRDWIKKMGKKEVEKMQQINGKTKRKVLRKDDQKG